jgi:glutamate-ammonia-ligase adenylyltransferase
MLTKARPIAGDETLLRDLARIADRVLYDAPPRPGVAAEVAAMRRRLESRARGRDVKRGFGGIVDVEFVAECLKLTHGHRLPRLRRPDTAGVIAAAHRERLLNNREHSALLTALQFLRSVESRIRIVWDMAQDRIPEDADERSRLARRLGYLDSPSTAAGDALLAEYEYHTRRTREVFEAVLARQ